VGVEGTQGEGRDAEKGVHEEGACEGEVRKGGHCEGDVGFVGQEALDVG
jgi:hypothetical protein